MTRRCSIALAALLAPLSAPALAAPPPSTDGALLASACAGRDGWSEPAPPVHVEGNTWYVGTCGITVLLVSTPGGLVLIDSGPMDAAPLVLANIARLGFKASEVRWLLTTHEHHDHAGSLAELQRATGAKLATLASARQVLETGTPSADDPQNGVLDPMPPSRVDRALADGDSVVVGGLAFTVHETPAHSPGSASWTWQSCDAKFTCRMIAYADSATTVSADGYRFSDHPDRIARIRVGHARIAGLPCDLLITPHPSASNLFARLAGKAPLIDPGACQAYAKGAASRFESRLADEAGTAASAAK
nr:subclass B3 metallo-beta-lactamase [uncultured bacterium]